MILKNLKKIISAFIFATLFCFPSFVSAETVTVNASPTKVIPGGTSRITWSYSAGTGNCFLTTNKNATSGIPGGSSGWYDYPIQNTSTVYVKCGTDEGSVVVTAVPISVAGNPSTVTSGGSSIISWVTPPNLTCNLFDNKNGKIKSSIETSGSFTAQNITSSTLFSVKCTDPQDNFYSGSTTITVQGSNNTNAPIVTTLPLTNVLDTSATGNGSVSGTGITEKGIVWGLNPNPRTWDWGGKNKVMLPGGPGDISVPFVHNTPNAKLHFRVYAIVPGTSNGDDGDHWYGKDIMFSTTSGDVLTGDAKEIVDTEAILTGSVNPLGKKTSGYFRYSTMETPPIFCNDIYGSDMKSTFEEKLGAGDSPISFETKVTDLNPGTKYYYCTVGSNNGEIRYGGVKSFYTLGTPGESSITTKSALVENSTAAFLNGSFIAGTDSKTWFEYRKFSSDGTNSWTKVNQESHKQNDTGDLKYELTNLTKKLSMNSELPF